MSCFSNQYNRLGDGKRLIRLLALLLAFAIAAPVLLAQDHNNEGQGRFVDPFVGSWIIHIHVSNFTPTSTPPPPFDFDNISAVWEDGITTSSDPTQGTSYGVWKNVGVQEVSYKNSAER